MKILLSTTPNRKKEYLIFPLGLACIASGLKNHNVVASDLNIANNPYKKLARIISGEKPDVIGFSLRNIDTTTSFDRYSYCDTFVTCLKKIKLVSRNATIVVGWVLNFVGNLLYRFKNFRYS